MARKPQETDHLRVSQLNQRGPTEVNLRPDAATRASLAQRLDLLELTQMRLEGRITPAEAGGFRFSGRLRAAVVQACGATLQSIRTRIDEPVSRHWSPYVEEPDTEGEEVEMGDDELEALGSVIDLGALAAEELSLALPPWPRAEGGKVPAPAAEDTGDEGETRRPFAGLDALLRKKD